MIPKKKNNVICKQCLPIIGRSKIIVTFSYKFGVMIFVNSALQTTYAYLVAVSICCSKIPKHFFFFLVLSDRIPYKRLNALEILNFDTFQHLIHFSKSRSIGLVQKQRPEESYLHSLTNKRFVTYKQGEWHDLKLGDMCQHFIGRFLKKMKEKEPRKCCVENPIPKPCSNSINKNK